jgi:hypothetical protein
MMYLRSPNSVRSKVKAYIILKEILLFPTTWMNLQDIMLNEISQTEKGKWYMNEKQSNS